MPLIFELTFLRKFSNDTNWLLITLVCELKRNKWITFECSGQLRKERISHASPKPNNLNY